jgi:hypothetical protein
MLERAAATLSEMAANRLGTLWRAALYGGRNRFGSLTREPNGFAWQNIGNENSLSADPHDAVPLASERFHHSGHRGGKAARLSLGCGQRR